MGAGLCVSDRRGNGEGVMWYAFWRGQWRVLSLPRKSDISRKATRACQRLSRLTLGGHKHARRARSIAKHVACHTIADRYRSVAGSVVVAAAAQSVYPGQHGQAAAEGAGSACQPSSSRSRRLPTLRTGPEPPADRLLATAEAADGEKEVGHRRFATTYWLHVHHTSPQLTLLLLPSTYSASIVCLHNRFPAPNTTTAGYHNVSNPRPLAFSQAGSLSRRQVTEGRT